MYILLSFCLLYCIYFCRCFFFPSNFVFSFDLMTNFNDVFAFFFFLYVYIYCRFSVCGYHEDQIYQSIYYINKIVLGLLISKAFQITYICALLFSQFFILVYLCADHFLPLLYACIFLVNFFIHNFLVSSPGLFFCSQRISFTIYCKAGLVVLNSLGFCLSIKVLIFSSNLNESLAGQSILGCRLFPFITLNILCHSLLACRVSAEKSANT